MQESQWNGCLKTGFKESEEESPRPCWKVLEKLKSLFQSIQETLTIKTIKPIFFLAFKVTDFI